MNNNQKHVACILCGEVYGYTRNGQAFVCTDCLSDGSAVALIVRQAAAIENMLKIIRPFSHPDLCELLPGNGMTATDAIIFQRNKAKLMASHFKAAHDLVKEVDELAEAEETEPLKLLYVLTDGTNVFDARMMNQYELKEAQTLARINTDGDLRWERNPQNVITEELLAILGNLLPLLPSESEMLDGASLNEGRADPFAAASVRLRQIEARLSRAPNV